MVIKMWSREKRLESLLRDVWFLLEVVSPYIEFNNGVVHMGRDEGDVVGWKMYDEYLEKTLKEIPDLLGEKGKDNGLE